MSYEKDNITSVLNRIRDSELVLPDIQRDFVWAPEQIYRLLDSILRDYPFGTLLFWNTKQRIQYREFSKDWSKGQGYAFQIKKEGRKGTLVLDGQQRLQSLYIAVHGSHENRILYFDVLSGIENGDVSEVMYRSEFLAPQVAELYNQQRKAAEHWVPLKDIVGIPSPDLLIIRTQQYQAQAGVQAESDEGMRLSRNLSNVFWKLRAQENLNYYIIDKDYGDDGHKTGIDEILEIFVRVNSGGQVLAKSDLMFSLIQLHWEEAITSITQLLDDLNAKGRFEFDKDFVLKCALVCCGKGARYEVRKLRDETTLNALRDSFPQLARALIACVDFVVNTARFQDGRILGSYNSLIPFIYFLYLQPNQMAKGEDTLLAMNQALYLALMTSGFSRYADSRIDHAVKHILNPVHSSQPGVFPLEAIRRYIGETEGKNHFDDKLLQNNIPLLMNILEGGSLLPEGRRYYRPEYDHIFPKSKLEELQEQSEDGTSKRRYTQDQINHYANLRLISKHQNIWKSNQDPQPYFRDHPKAAQRYLIPTDYLEYDQFPQFLEERRRLIWDRLQQFLGISADEGAEVATQTESGLSRLTADSTALPTTLDETELMRQVLTRIPVSRGQRVLIDALFQAGDQGLSASELALTLKWSRRRIPGVLGALGRRINATDGVDQIGQPGIGLLFRYQWENGQWRYWLRPDFRALLVDDQEVARLVLNV